MNKITIPAILVATVMVAGAFAFMPVEQATTVHTTIQATTVPKVFTDNEGAGADDFDVGDIFTLDCTADYSVVGIAAFATGTIADEDLTVTIGGTLVTDDAGVALIDEGAIALITTGHAADDTEDTVITALAMSDEGDEEVDLRVSVITSGTCTLVSDDD